ncbi:MAG TPA: hypothetical protein VG125_10350 [Pirellulales bacterium]|jgi:hypothetical protein|nr:hypothetical protein [Pirellulales bacterium]
MTRSIANLILLATAFAAIGEAAQGQARVELELATSSAFPATAQQEWYRLLSELGVDGLRIRKAQSEDKVEVKVAGSKQAPVYRVVGRLASGNQLELPGGKFALHDRAGLSKWLAKLRAEGPEASGGGGATTPFGLNAKQLAAANADLAAPVAFDTKGITPAEFLEKLAPALKYPLNVDRATKQRLAHAEPIGDQLQGLASGTALAYALRSQGLGLLPRIGETKKLEYAVVKPGGAQAAWPVGWPLQDRKPIDLLPELFEHRNAEIDDFPLAETLEAICDKLKTPVLYDHYALARQGIDAAKVNVKFPASRTWYAKVLEKVLHQAKLKGEWRVDEAGKPLLWVTTLKPVEMGR